MKKRSVTLALLVSSIAFTLVLALSAPATALLASGSSVVDLQKHAALRGNTITTAATTLPAGQPCSIDPASLVLTTLIDASAAGAFIGDCQLAVGPDSRVVFAHSVGAGTCALVSRVEPGGSISHIGGTGIKGYSGDGGSALLANLYTYAVAVASDGSTYLTDPVAARVRRIAPDGTIATVVGSGDLTAPNCSVNQEGLLATDIWLAGTRSVAFGPDGSLYVLEDWENRVLRVDPAGTVTRVVGTAGLGPDPYCDEWGGYAGDGGPAIDARLNKPTRIAIGPDGRLVILDNGNGRVRRIEHDGTINTVAIIPGLSTPDALFDSFWAAEIAVGPDSKIYFAMTDWQALNNLSRRIYRVEDNGELTTVAGTGEGPAPPSPGTTGPSPDGTPALQANLAISAFAIGPDCRIYIADGYDEHGYSDGRIRILAAPGGSPPAEICDNGIDDDGDGFVDTEDVDDCEPYDFNDGELVREVSGSNVYVMYGGAKFLIPDDATFSLMQFDRDEIDVVPNGTMASISQMPTDDVVLQEFSSRVAYFVSEGRKYEVPDAQSLASLKFDTDDVGIVPDGALAAIPAAPNLSRTASAPSFAGRTCKGPYSACCKPNYRTHAGSALRFVYNSGHSNVEPFKTFRSFPWNSVFDFGELRLWESRYPHCQKIRGRITTSETESDGALDLDGDRIPSDAKDLLCHDFVNPWHDDLIANTSCHALAGHTGGSCDDKICDLAKGWGDCNSYAPCKTKPDDGTPNGGHRYLLFCSLGICDFTFNVIPDKASRWATSLERFTSGRGCSPSSKLCTFNYTGKTWTGRPDKPLTDGDYEKCLAVVDQCRRCGDNGPGCATICGGVKQFCRSGTRQVHMEVVKANQPNCQRTETVGSLSHPRCDVFGANGTIYSVFRAFRRFGSIAKRSTWKLAHKTDPWENEEETGQWIHVDDKRRGRPVTVIGALVTDDKHKDQGGARRCSKEGKCDFGWPELHPVWKVIFRHPRTQASAARARALETPAHACRTECCDGFSEGTVVANLNACMDRGLEVCLPRQCQHIRMVRFDNRTVFKARSCDCTQPILTGVAGVGTLSCGQQGGVVCDAAYVQEFDSATLNRLHYEGAEDSCSALRLHVYVDDVYVQTTDYLGWPDALGDCGGNPCDALELATGPLVPAGVSPGRHVLKLVAEGLPSGCHPDGVLDSWEATLVAQEYPEPLAAQ